MGARTKIQWCGSTVNPTMGCAGCELWRPGVVEKTCDAGRLHVARDGQKGYAPTFGEVTRFPGWTAAAAAWSDLAGAPRPDKPWLDGLPRLIFVSDMSDALSPAVPFDYLEREVVEVVTSVAGRRHLWLWLTKRAGRMAELTYWLKVRGKELPDNLWVATSVTTAYTAARIPALLQAGGPGTVRFVSVEPQRGPIDLSPWLPRLNWVIQGGESGRGATAFHAEWAADLLGQCRAAGVPDFLKQLGSAAYRGGRRLQLADGHGGEWSEWPPEVRVRETPRVSEEGDSRCHTRTSGGRIPLW